MREGHVRLQPVRVREVSALWDYALRFGGGKDEGRRKGESRIRGVLRFPMDTCWSERYTIFESASSVFMKKLTLKYTYFTWDTVSTNNETSIIA